MRWLALLLFLWPVTLQAQSSTVAPHELSLTVTVQNEGPIPYTREMVMILIRGVYRRHVTRETLEQPKLEGFNWTQLGPDYWYEERINGQKVKVLERRMALYPERAGTLTIGAFTHHLTLTDESDDWFDHDITSEPVTVKVAAAPVQQDGDWWFPVRRLQIADTWSNTPDQLKPGEGVLRVIRIEALGATPEMIPPMPELQSPSAMIFAHPERRMAELTPLGPVTYAFWRWTIQPTNDRSAIVEPIRFSYFDTENRVMRDVTITAQRIAYDAAALPPVPAPVAPARLPGWPLAVLMALTVAGGLGHALRGRQADFPALARRVPLLDPLARRLLRARDLAEARAAARALMLRDGITGAEADVLNGLDRAVFARDGAAPGVRCFASAFLRARRRAPTRVSEPVARPVTGRVT
ncbi:BatD family protein [Sagittula salina]|uniref:BatD family protein n=1 Tax=Sagittula salina TaxID=2820268 RepID=A0A940S546_9RHOB|nr:BatD family protein [Sagittula salina]MBP0484774.1 BatD family protein [Sagittula salina]